MSEEQIPWWQKSAVYQIYPRSFKDSNGDGYGDIQGIIEKLDYIYDLGVDVVWLSPVYDSPQVDNGYDIRDYQAIDETYGTMQDFDSLLSALHSRGMKLIMDLVVNHTSDEHRWFTASKSAKYNNPYRDYYIWRDGKDADTPPNRWGSTFGGSAWEYDAATEQYYLHLFHKKQPDLNWEHPALRKSIYEMMHYWSDKGVDGFRMDVINYISKDQDFPEGEISEGEAYSYGGRSYTNGPRVHEFLHELHEEALAGHDMLTVGEMPGASPGDAVRYTDPKNKELDMVFTFEHMDIDSKSDKWDWKNLELVALKQNFEKWQTALADVGWNSLYWNNHDQPRIVSRFGNDGEYRVKSAKMLATCLHFMKGTPYIYQGEEIGMTNVHFENLADYKDIETLNMYREKQAQGWSHERIMAAIHRKGRDNARTPMQWDDSVQAGFTTGSPWLAVNPRYTEINAAAGLDDPHSVYYYYQKLIQLRKREELMISGKFEMLLREDPHLFVYRRSGERASLLVICNFSDQTLALDQALIEEAAAAEILVTNRETETEHRNSLEPYEAIVFKLEAK